MKQEIISSGTEDKLYNQKSLCAIAIFIYLRETHFKTERGVNSFSTCIEKGVENHKKIFFVKDHRSVGPLFVNFSMIYS